MSFSKRVLKSKDRNLLEYMSDFPDGIGINNAVSLLLPVALQLRDKHMNGETHLQVSPNLIQITPKGTVLNAPTESEADRYESGFAAPEIYRGENCGLEADIYSFCAVLFYTAFGNVPDNAVLREENKSHLFSEGKNSDFSRLLEKGMAIDEKDRFKNMQEVIYGISRYNTEKYIIENNHSRKTGYTAQKSENNKGRILKIIVSVVSICIAIVLIYLGCRYAIGFHYAKIGNPEKVNQVVNKPSFTKIFDPKLATFSIASHELINGHYDEAGKLFESLGKYLSSEKMVHETDYRYATACFQEKDYEKAILLYSDLSESGYKDSETRLMESKYKLGMYYLNDLKDSISAYRILFELKDNEKYVDTFREIENLTYLKGQELYHRRQFSESGEYFSCVLPYSDSGKYLRLLKARKDFYSFDWQKKYENLIEIFDFEDTKEVIVVNTDLAKQFLQGEWFTDDRRFYFKVGDRVSYNLPHISYGDYFQIKEGIYQMYPEGQENLARNIFKIKVNSLDSIEIYSYKDGSTYKLYRQ